LRVIPAPLPATIPVPYNQIREREAMAMQKQQKLVRKRVRRLAEEDIAQIKAHLQQGKSPTVIARYFEVNPRVIYSIRAKETYRRVAPATEAIPLSKLSKIMRGI
jgi:DNA invertase Pin-like site-specific DNA recombinase